MVGVARSQGCRACRRKKKGCDLQRPKCGQCARLGLPCGYEGKVWTFVAQKHGPAKHSTSSNTSTRTSPSRDSPQAPDLLDQSLGLTALEIQVVDEFWSRYFPREDLDTVFLDGAQAAPWRVSLQDLFAQEDVISLGVRACAFMSLGRMDGKPGYVDHARRLYGRAIQETNLAIQDPSRVVQDAVLVSCKLLGIFEHFRLDRAKGPTTQGTDWQRHTEGMCRIIELRGPSMLAGRHGEIIFEDTRIIAFISSMSSHKPNFLCREGWPWQRDPAHSGGGGKDDDDDNKNNNIHSAGVPQRRHQTLRSLLVDIMVQIPRVLQETDVAVASPLSSSSSSSGPKLHAAHATLAHGLALARRLREWEAYALQRSVAASALPPPAAAKRTLLDASTAHGFGFMYLVMLYLAGSIVLHSSLRGLAQSLARRQQQQQQCVGGDGDAAVASASLLLPPSIHPFPFVKAVAAVAPRFFDARAGLWGPQVVTLGVGAALHYLVAQRGGTATEEWRRLKALLRGRDSGADFLRSLAAGNEPLPSTDVVGEEAGGA